ncbi:SDR family oxidoreductase [Micromonospora schwarzwaldensis]|uniref:SDR family oxidoreductase n=1 Tax=Micromonospora sp. DSM 45708 TaxID=3111767 RepID=UPI0031CE96AB
MRVLLLGASGYVGGALWRSWADRHDVVGTRGARDVEGLVRADLTDVRALTRLARDGFDLVVHAAGLVGLEQAEAHPERAWRLNVESVRILLAAVQDRPTRIVYLSSDQVFDGSREAYVETDPTAPVNAYGRTKVAAERLLDGGPHLVVRIPLVYGRSPVADRFLARFRGARTPAPTDILCAPVYLPSVATALEASWTDSGVVHLGGREVLSRFELMSRVRDALDLPTEVVPVRNADSPNSRLRPGRLVLRSAGREPLEPDLETALHHLRRHGDSSRKRSRGH